MYSFYRYALRATPQSEEVLSFDEMFEKKRPSLWRRLCLFFRLHEEEVKPPIFEASQHVLDKNGRSMPRRCALTREHAGSYHFNVDKNDIMPQADEAPTTVRFDELQEQTSESYGGKVVSAFDEMMTASTPYANFFERPVLLRCYEWDIGSFFSQTVDVWATYLSNPVVANKLARFRLLTCDSLELEFRINGTPFHQGRLLVSYLPRPNSDNFKRAGAQVQVDAVGGSQRPHVYLDPCNGKGATMCVPLFYPEGALDLTDGEAYQNIGEITLLELNELKRVNPGTTQVNVSVWASMKGIKLAIPTEVNPAFILPQADEYSTGDGPVSKVASTISRWAGYLTNIPTIGPFATATQIGARGVGQIATLFGYSSPVLLNTHIYRPETVTTLANTNRDSEGTKLTFDGKQELTIDPGIVGLSPTDELSFQHIAGIESYLTTFTWSPLQATETLLFNMRVDPGLHNIFNGERHMTALCMVSQPFQYWRGDITVRFQCVSSMFQKGRIKFVYEPVEPTATVGYNTVLTEIYDLESARDFTMKVGWGSPTAFRERIPVGLTSTNSEMFGETLLPADLQVGNGVLSVYVVNELTIPDDTLNGDVEFNVMVSSDNIEFAGPTSEIVSRIRPLSVVPQSQEVEPQSEEVLAVLPTTSPDVKMLKTPSMTDGTTLEYFGENIASFRALLKRWNRCFELPVSVPTAPNGDVYDVDALLPVFPRYRGFQGSFFAGIVPFWSYNTVDGTYMYGPTTMLNYVGMCFAGRRGGIQYMIDASQLRGEATVNVSRQREQDGLSPTIEIFDEADINTPAAQAQMSELYSDSMGIDGASMQNNGVNPITVVEIPWYSNLKFANSRRFTPPGFPQERSDHSFQTVFRGIRPLGGSINASVPYLVRAGEDLTFHFWTGAPAVVFETVVPSS